MERTIQGFWLALGLVGFVLWIIVRLLAFVYVSTIQRIVSTKNHS